MKLLKKHIHKDVEAITDPNILKRTAARGIIVKDNQILLIYTKRYNDYSIPGGGVDSHENIEEGLLRELQEETGAQNIQIIDNFGLYEEQRPTHYEGYDVMHMTSHFFVCSADYELGQAAPEDYEIKNGSAPMWVDIAEAIKHNEQVISQKESSMGLSIERETFMLNLIMNELML